MPLVAYPDSDDSLCSSSSLSSPPLRKKQRRSSRQEPLAAKRTSQDLPPLPANFHNLYSSSVRVSTTDDPSLHSGRTRIVPHIPGNWATHVYLEWFPDSTQHSHLNNLLAAVSNPSNAHRGGNDNTTTTKNNNQIHSLLETPLGVPLPLHISLSAPLVLRTETKSSFLETLKTALLPLLETTLRAGLTVTPTTLSWHPNENGSRGFLVLGLLEHSDRRRQTRRTETRSLREKGGAQTGTEAQSRRVAGEDRVTGEGRRRGHVRQQRGTEARFGCGDGSTELREHEGDSVARREEDEESWGVGRHEQRECDSNDNDSDDNDKTYNHIRNPGLNALLEASNRVAREFDQPQLYTSSLPSPPSPPTKQHQQHEQRPNKSPQNDEQHEQRPNKSPQNDQARKRGDFSGSFHISIAWALSIPPGQEGPDTMSQPRSWPSEVENALAAVKAFRIHISELKIRIGKDVCSLPFGGGVSKGKMRERERG